MVKKIICVIMLIMALNSINGEYPWGDYSYWLESTSETTYGVNDSYWIENLSNNNYTVWAKVSVPAHKNISFTIERGGEANQPNGDAVFEFFDDFEGNSLDTNKWDIEEGTAPTVENGYLNINKECVIVAKNLNMEKYIWEGKIKIVSLNYPGFLYNHYKKGYYYDLHFEDGTIHKHTGSLWSRTLIADGIMSLSTNTEYHFNHIITGNTAKLNVGDKIYSLNMDTTYNKGSVGFLQYHSNGQMYVYYTFVRKYADQEPTITINKINDSAWNITITNNNDYDLVDYQVGLNATNTNDITNKIHVSSIDDSLTISSFRDVYYTYKVWTKVDVLAGQTVRLLVKNYDTYAPNGDDVFEFFDDFSDATLSKWNGDKNGFTVNNGVLIGSNTNYRITSIQTFSSTDKLIFTTKHKVEDTATNGYEVLGFYGSSSNGWLGYLPHGSPYTYRHYDRLGNSWTYRGQFNYYGTWKLFDIIINNGNYHTTISNTNYDFTGTLNFDNLPIALGKRYDNELTGQTYNGEWDYIYVRKYADQEPTITVNQINNNEWIVKVDNEGSGDLTNFQIPFELQNLINNRLNISLLPPDLTINSVDLESTGINTTFTVNYKNTGDSSTMRDFIISLYADGAQMLNKTVSTLNTEDSSTMTFSYPTKDIYNKNLTITVDSSNLIQESNETNNNWTGKITELPDLTITNVDTELSGTLVKFNIHYANQGNASAGGKFTITLSTDSYNTSKEVNDLNIGASDILTLSAPIYDVINKQITIEIDSADNIYESNEGNNIYTVSEIPLPDLNITNVLIDQTDNSKATFTVNYKNIGNASTGTGFWIGLFANDILVDEEHVGELNKNSSSIVELEGENYFGQVGQYKIYIDYRGGVYETNESNNIKIINTQLPDLTITNAEKIDTGTKIKINYTNIGDTDVANFSISLYIDDIEKYNTIINTPLQPNQFIEETLNWDISDISGDREVYIMIDSGNNYIELNEWNNIYYLQGNYEPYATFTYSLNGTTVNFDASQSKDIDGNIAVYSWDFGDGNSGSGVSPSHQYNKEGMYKVVLTVNDDGGKTGTTFRNIYISGSPVSTEIQFQFRYIFNC